jgi:hypothetical protein
MANPARAEIAFPVGDTEYTLKLSTNAICELEYKIDMGLPAIVLNMERLTMARGLLWASLRAKHPEVSLEQAGDIIDACGIKAVTEAITRVLIAYSPPQEEGDEKKA